MRCKTELAAIARSMHHDNKIAITIALFVPMIAFMDCIVVDFQFDYASTVLEKLDNIQSKQISQ